MEDQTLAHTTHLQKLWQQIPCSHLCCMCPWNRALILMECGHGLCERDAWQYSVRREPHGLLSYFPRCPACHAVADIQVRLRPLQAGYRIASFDGGGTRGIVSLEALGCILERLPLGLEAHDYFDFAAGTSAGTMTPCAG